MSHDHKNCFAGCLRCNAHFLVLNAQLPGLIHFFERFKLYLRIEQVQACCRMRLCDATGDAQASAA